MAKAMTAKELHWVQGKKRGNLRALKPRLVQWAKKYKSQTVAPTNVDKPAIMGQPLVGHTLETTMGNWNGEPTAYGAQWFRGSTAIKDATFAKYLLTPADLGAVHVEVTAFTGGGQAMIASDPVTVS